MESWESIDYNKLTLTLTLDVREGESDNDNNYVIDLSKEFDNDEKDIVVHNPRVHKPKNKQKQQERIKKSTVDPNVKVPLTPLTPKEIMEQQIQSDMDISASTFGF